MLNPATFLPTEEGPPDHDCKEVMDKVYFSLPDLKDTLLWDPELELFTDGSNSDGSNSPGRSVKGLIHSHHC
jgi:hypothetical protein